MTRKTTVTRAPYTPGGSLYHYVNPSRQRWAESSDVQWRPNEPFAATLTLRGSVRGRSAAYTEWTDADGHVYPMFLADLVHLVQTATVVEGRVQGRWMVAKRGQNYGVRLCAAEH